MIALIALVDCALAGDRECRALAAGTGRWHEIVVSNEAFPAGYRAALGLSLAKFHAAAGHHDAAVAAAARAGTLAGDNLAYRLQEATLYGLLGRNEELAAALEEIEAAFPRRAPGDPTFIELRARLRSSADRT
ncbi:MAG: hypothetical protein GWO02_04445 [Gammaproteobacteria bacterium]|nr:hypothetical protein [Gammaproteobacteria bacterium]